MTKKDKAGEDKDEEGQKERSIINNMSIRRLSLNPSLANMTINSSKTERNRALDPTIVDNDLELPHITEPRMRPAPDFVPQGGKKAKVLKPVTSKKPELMQQLVKKNETSNNEAD